MTAAILLRESLMPGRAATVCLGLLAAVMLWTATPGTAQPAAFEPDVIHITDYLNDLDVSRKAIQEFDESDRTTTGFRKAGGPAYEVGETKAFKVYNHSESERNGRFTLESLEFTARAVDERFVVWVETSEIEKGHVRDEDVAALVESLAETTPPSSIDPSAGIVVNNERIFGTPPDVDGDGATDILLVDVRDGWEPGSKSGYIAGFVWAGDLTRSGNASDIVYVDTYPGLYRNGTHIGTQAAAATLSHEYLHLIHMNYDANELTFVDEGLAEWASIMNGYSARRISYLGDVREQDVSLFDWRSGADLLKDYERAALFTTYLAQRLGPEAIGEIVRRKSGGTALRGTDGYESVLADEVLSLAGVLTDFHVANLINDRTIADQFGYEIDAYQSVGAVPTRRYDAVTPGSSDELSVTLRPGAARYFVWTNATRLEASVDVSSSYSTSDMRERVSARLIAERGDGPALVERVNLGASPVVLDGPFTKVSLVLVHHDPDESGVAMDVSARWSDATTGVATADDEMPFKLALDQNYPNPFNPRTIIRYVIPNAGPVRLTVFDALGREVARPVDDVRQAGEYEITLDAAGWASGVYLYSLETAGRREVRRMTLLR